MPLYLILDILFRKSVPGGCSNEWTSYTDICNFQDLKWIKVAVAMIGQFTQISTVIKTLSGLAVLVMQESAVMSAGVLTSGALTVGK